MLHRAGCPFAALPSRLLPSQPSRSPPARPSRAPRAAVRIERPACAQRERLPACALAPAAARLRCCALRCASHCGREASERRVPRSVYWVPRMRPGLEGLPWRPRAVKAAWLVQRRAHARDVWLLSSECANARLCATAAVVVGGGEGSKRSCAAWSRTAQGGARGAQRQHQSTAQPRAVGQVASRAGGRVVPRCRRCRRARRLGHPHGVCCVCGGGMMMRCATPTGMGTCCHFTARASLFFFFFARTTLSTSLG